MNVCSLFVFVFVTRHVSEPYNRTDFTFVPKILILFCREREVALQMGHSGRVKEIEIWIKDICLKS